MDISKTFDKIWTQGLQYKIMELEMPDIIEKVLCNFLENRTAKIRIQDHIGKKIPLLSGVPQGSIISPTLFILYTAKIDPPSPGCLDISFADDITQIIIIPQRSKEMLARKTETEIIRVNKCEDKWKIQTNKAKFQLLSISAAKPKDVIINNQIIQFQKHVTILGLKIGTRGVASHIKTKIAMANGQLTKLKRFNTIDTEIKIHLYKTLLRLVLEYPISPTCIASNTNYKKMQQFQNKAIRNAIKGNEEGQELNTEQLHEKYKIQAVNVRFHQLANKIWDNFGLINNNLLNESNRMNTLHEARDHSWWRRISFFVAQDPPEPKYQFSEP